MVSVDCLTSYLSSLGVYDSSSVVEYLGIGMEEVVDIETINMKLWDDLSQAIQIVRLVSHTWYSCPPSTFYFPVFLQYRQP